MPLKNKNIYNWAIGIILYILGSGGKHPIYKPGIKKDDFENHLLNVDKTGWKFPNYFPM